MNSLKIDGKVYKITNKINGKCYIGITKKSINKRFSIHCSNKSNSGISGAINKYGRDNFIIEQIDSSDNPADLFELETFHIRKNKSLVPNGYNIIESQNAIGIYSNLTISEKMRLNKINSNNKQYTNVTLVNNSRTSSKSLRFRFRYLNNGKNIQYFFRSLIDAVNYRNKVLFELTNDESIITPINYIDWIFEFYRYYIERLIIVNEWQKLKLNTL